MKKDQWEGHVTHLEIGNAFRILLISFMWSDCLEDTDINVKSVELFQDMVQWKAFITIKTVSFTWKQEMSSSWGIPEYLRCK